MGRILRRLDLVYCVVITTAIHLRRTSPKFKTLLSVLFASNLLPAFLISQCAERSYPRFRTGDEFESTTPCHTQG